MLDQTAQFLRNIKNHTKASMRQYLGMAVKSFSRPKAHKETIVFLYIPCLRASLVVVLDEVWSRIERHHSKTEVEEKCRTTLVMVMGFNIICLLSRRATGALKMPFRVSLG